MRRSAIMPRFLLAMLGSLALSGCGGSSSPSSPATPTPTPTPTATATPAAANVADVILDAGPATLSSNNAAFNTPFVTVTICAPGSTTNCQTIDHVLLDTGSVGLRIIGPVINAALLAALPPEMDNAGNPVAECYQFVTSYQFGSVRQADFKIAGETVANMPFQTVGDGGAFANVPASCSSGGGAQTATVNDLEANAILGIGSTGTDCGALCQSASNNAGALYYDCPASGCDQIIARTASTVAPFQQLPNPVAAFAVDNNGTILTLPAVPQAGAAALSGTLTFGIGTQADNHLTAATLLTLTTSQSNRGPGLLTATYKGKIFPQSYLDTGSAAYYFVDTSLTACTGGSVGFYCPPSPITLSPTLTGLNDVTASAAFTLYNPNALAAGVNVAPGLGINPEVAASMMQTNDQSFGFGIPFYFGRTVFTAIEGVDAGGTPGPYVAF